LSDKNKIKKILRFKTKKTKKDFLKSVVNGIHLILEGQKKLKGIGVSVASPVLNGVVLNPPNLPLKNFNLEKFLRKKFRVKVKVENDANCYALAELKYGCGKNCKNFVLVAIGTGIGGGIVINGKLYTGKGCAGEIGHIIISDSNKRCNAGHNGCFEAMASGRAIFELSEKRFGKGYLASELSEMARKGNKKAKKLLNEIGYYLGRGFVSIANIFNPDMIIVSGGVKEGGELLLKEARKILKKDSMDTTELKISKINKGALLGAIALIK